MSSRPQHVSGVRGMTPRGGFPQQNLQRFTSNPIPQFATGANSQPLPNNPRHAVPGSSGLASDAVSVSDPTADSEQHGGKVPFEWRQDLDAKRLRKSIYRRTVDYFTPVVKYIEVWMARSCVQ